jgi:hypothetical protein
VQDNGHHHHHHWARGSKEHPFLNHFISFTSLFYFAITYAARKLRNKEKKIKIAVLDSYKLGDDVLAFSSFPSTRACEIQSEIIKESSFAEFLIWDEILPTSVWSTLLIYSRPSEAL